MSFDLAVMNVQEQITSAEAGEIYSELCEGRVDVVQPSEHVDSFYQELIGEYPDIDSYPYEDVDHCPWSVKLDISDGAVVMSMVWSRVEEVVPFVMKLAAKHDLACYDPQEEKVWLPPSLPAS